MKQEDSEILYQLQNIFPIKSTIRERERNTNFKKEYKSKTLVFYDYEFRSKLKSIGMISGNKEGKIKIPTCDFSKKDFYRGVIDGDGSLGFTTNDIPFLSLFTKSENIKNNFLNFIKQQIGVEKKLSRNKRDNAYNIILKKNKCKKIVSLLYYKDCLSIKRKYQLAQNIKHWNKKIKNKG